MSTTLPLQPTTPEVRLRRRRLQPARAVGRLVLYVGLAVISFILIFPLLYAISGSLMTSHELVVYPPTLIPAHPNFNAYAQANQALPLLRDFLNSAIMSVGIMLGQLITATLSAYAFVFLRVPFRRIAFGIFMATMFIPWEAVILPNYLLMASAGLLNTYWALILPFLAAGFGTFLLRQFFMSFPKDLYEAARIDGCGHLRFLWTILVPLSRPALASLGIYVFLQSWNQYFWPLLVGKSNAMLTLQIAIRSLKISDTLQSPNLVLAGTVLAIIPTVLLIFLGQRYIVRGLIAGALRG
ncbi:MAG: carbohydrate ABC transporter permease [Candidatus Dormibacteraceae bacterium]